MQQHRNAKIVATLGPSTSSQDAIAALVAAGVDVFRLNFSHGTQEDHRQRLKAIRALERRRGEPIGVLADLQGPKLRVGTFADGPVTLAAGQAFRLDTDRTPGTAARAPLPHPEIFAALKPGSDLLLDDGRIRLEVTDHGADYADTRVIIGGPLSDHKGVNVPSVVLDISPITEKDRADLAFALDMGVDWVALSFVQRPSDVDEALALINGRAWLMAKLEKPSAIQHLLPIVAKSDGVMVARGDLGVEMPAEEVPPIQRRIIRAARSAGKPVVVATQMLDSMVRSPVPTRAEASDVASAIYEGADAVMLSQETAIGTYPTETVTMMDRIITSVERDSSYRLGIDASRGVPETTPADALTAAARQVAETIGASVIVTFTAGGSTTLRAARERPPVRILTPTPDQTIARRLALVWGAHPLLVPTYHDLETMLREALRLAVRAEMARPGDRVVLLAGLPLMHHGTTNVLRIAVVDETDAPPSNLA